MRWLPCQYLYLKENYLFDHSPWLAQERKRLRTSCHSAPVTLQVLFYSSVFPEQEEMFTRFFIGKFFYTKAHFSFSISSRSCEADIKELPLINLAVSQQRKSTIVLFWRAGQNLYGLTYADWTSALRTVLCQLGEFFLQTWWLIQTQLFIMPVCMHTHSFRAVLQCQCSAIIL